MQKHLCQHLERYKLQHGNGSPGETRTLVGGSRGPYAWPLHHRASQSKRLPRFFTYNFNVGSFIPLLSQSLLNAVAFLADHVPIAATPQRIHNRVLALPVSCGAEDFVWVLVGVVTVTVPTELLHVFFSHCFSSQSAGLVRLRKGVRL